MNVKSILQKLRNHAQASNLSFQQTLQLFCQEEFLRRLAISKHKNSLILKGGFFLYLISNFESRPTMDIDFLSSKTASGGKEISILIQSINATETHNTYISFEMGPISVISEQNKNHGYRIKMFGLIDNTRTPFNIDIGIGDTIVPGPARIKIQTILPGFQSPEVLAYTMESIIAEKWDAIMDRLELNSRMKDFYDIYFLANKFSFDCSSLQKAISETLITRGRAVNKNSIKIIDNLKENKSFVNKWVIFSKKTLQVQLDFETVLNLILAFIKEPFESTLSGKNSTLFWDNQDKTWKP